MISKINLAQGMQQVQFKPAFKANEEESGNITVPEQKVNFKGAEALGNYNKPNIMTFDKSLLDVEPVLPTVIQPDALESIEGEKIYSSNGKLNSIVNRVGENIVVYNVSAENDNMIETIVTTDKKTGNMIKRQYNDIEDGKYTNMRVTEYDAKTGDEVGSTSYENGEPSWASKTVTNPRGLTQYINYEYSDGHYYVDEILPHKNEANRHYEFDKNKNLVSIYQNKEVRGSKIDSEVQFYNGSIVSFTETKKQVMPNNMGNEVLQDPDMTPAELSEYPDTIEGEKTFYSNGALESVTSGDVVYTYSPDGEVASIKDGNKLTEFKDLNTRVVTETLDDGAVRTTEYHLDNNLSIIGYNNNGYEKCLYLDNGKPDYYYEDKDGERIKSLHFNNDGMLEAAYEYDV